MTQVKVRLNLDVARLWPPGLDIFSELAHPPVGHMIPQAKEWFAENGCDVDQMSALTDFRTGETVGFRAARKVT